MKVLAGVLALVVCVGGVLAFYRWTTHSTGIPVDFSAPVSNDRYNQLTDAFDAGRLDLGVEVPAGLAALRDPYDPGANAPYRATGYQDLVFRNGKLYTYWGPTPAVTLFWPARALGIGRFPQVYAVALFAALAFVCAAGLLWTLTRRFIPQTPVWMQCVGLLALGAGGVWAWLIRRPEVYEVAIAAASAFMFAGLWLLAIGGLGPRVRPVAVGLGALCLGLAMGSRISVGAAVLAPAALLAWRRRRDPYRAWVRLLAVVAVPLLACAVALMVYNQQRFGSPLDFGTDYLLLSPDDVARGPSLANVPTGLWFYLLGQLHFFAAFPFFHVEPPARAPFHIPDDWAVRDRSGGLLTMQPLVLFLLGAWRLRAWSRAAAWVVAALVAIATVLLLFDAFYVNGITQRYAADFTPLLLVAALLTWFGVHAAEARPLWRAAIAWAGAALALFGTAVGALLSMSGPDATLPFAWENLVPKLNFIAPVARSLPWNGIGHEAWLLAVLVAVGPVVLAGAGWVVVRTRLDEHPRAPLAGAAVAVAGAAVVLLAILLPRGDAAAETFGTGRALAVAAGVVVALVGLALRVGAGPRAARARAPA